ncbi:MAG: response regulator, partial [Gemmatirosa sp.]
MSSRSKEVHDQRESDALEALSEDLASRRYARRGISMREEPIRVVLVDDHEVLRAGVRALLSTAPEVLIVGEAVSGIEGVRAAERLLPDVVVMDLDMPGGDGAEATRALCALPTPPKVLILSMHTEEERLIPLLELGASGYLAKDVAERDLVEAIRVVAAGDTYVRPHVARLLAASMRRRGQIEAQGPDAQHRAFATLSDREKTVLRMVAEGYNGPEIGEQLGISPKTVDTYKQRVEEKLGISHRT